MSTPRAIMNLAVASALLALTACSDVFNLDVEAPGRIADDDLNNPDALPGVVVGMSYDLTDAVDAVLQDVNMAGGEIWHGGSYDYGDIPLGLFKEDDLDWDGEWGSLQQARWVAEEGLRRIHEVVGATVYEGSPDVARAYLLGGFANRLLGELQCRTVIDGGADLPHTENFNRADSMFTRAIAIGQAAGNTEIVRAAYGGRASVRASLGRWPEAAADAANVPTSFVFGAVFSIANQNDFAWETTPAVGGRREMSVYSTMWTAGVVESECTGDMRCGNDTIRVPWFIPRDNKGQVLKGQDGQTPYYQQTKFTTVDADVPLTKGTEARLIQAEAALRNNDYAGAETFINEARAQYGMTGLTLPATQVDAWPVLRYERYATNWLEGRRLWDMRRWQAEGAPKADPFAEGRDLCFPISHEETRSNPNVNAQVGGCPTCG